MCAGICAVKSSGRQYSTPIGWCCYLSALRVPCRPLKICPPSFHGAQTTRLSSGIADVAHQRQYDAVRPLRRRLFDGVLRRHDWLPSDHGLPGLPCDRHIARTPKATVHGRNPCCCHRLASAALVTHRRLQIYATRARLGLPSWHIGQCARSAFTTLIAGTALIVRLCFRAGPGLASLR